MSNNNYPLDEKALEEQYADLLLKIALKEYLKEQALQMKQQEAEAAPAPQPAQESSNVVAVAFRQVGWQETKETLLHGLKKGVTRVAVVFLAAALTATTAFALSPVERKESILEKVINTIRNYADMLTNTSTMVEVPRYRYEEYSFIEVPNEQVQEVIDTWVIFRNSVNFTEKSGISLSAVMRAMYYYCEAKGLEYPYTDDTHTWVDAKAVQQFAEYLFGATKEHLDWEVYLEPRYYDAERDAYWALGATIQYRDRPLALVALFRERDKADFNPKEFHILHTLKDALERKFYDLLAEPAAGVLPAERLRQAAAGYGLTKRETEIAELVCRNLSTEEICEKLYLAPATLSKHLSNIYDKVKVTGRIALMALLTGTANKA